MIIGDDELAAGIFTVKRLSDGTQQKLAEAELFTHLTPRRRGLTGTGFSLWGFSLLEDSKSS